MLRRWIACLLVAAVGGVYLSLFDPGELPWAPKCAFKLLTGLSCPGCGLQRFAHAAISGNWATALSYNYFLVLSLPYALAFVIVWLIPDCALRRKVLGVIESKVAIYTYVAAFFVWWVLRNALGI